MRIFLLTLILCLGVSGSLQAYGQTPPGRVALVIGNSDYTGRTPDLPNPVNDAALMAMTLEKLGFDVDIRTNLSRGEMDEAFRAHRDRLSAGGPDAVGLFYYAGHGVQLDDANYLIPVSSTARFRQDLRGEPQLGTAISYMREAGNAVNIVIIDACKDSPYPDRVGLGRTAAGKGGLSTPGRSEGVFIAYAAQPGQTAADGAGANSPFTQALAEVMKVPGLDLDDVFQEVAWRVVGQSGGEQWPYYSSGLIGRDVCLAGCESVAAQPLLASDESTALAQAITANTLAAFTEFRERFPVSANMAFVETKIAELNPQATDFTKVGRLLAKSSSALEPTHTITSVQQRHKFEHEDWVFSASLSSSGHFVLTGSLDASAKVWEANTGRLIHVLEGHEEALYAVAFSPDERFAVTGSSDDKAKIWSVDTGQLVRTLEGHTDTLYAVSFSSDGQLVLTASGDNTAKLWVASTGRLIHSLEGHNDDIWAASFSPDDRFIVTGAFDRSVRVWDVATGELVHMLASDQYVSATAFSPDGRFVVTGGGDWMVNFWDMETGSLVRNLAGHSGDINAIGFSADGRIMITGSSDRTTKFWDTVNGQVIYTMKGHTGDVTSAMMSLDARFAVTSSEDKDAKLWQLEFE